MKSRDITLGYTWRAGAVTQGQYGVVHVAISFSENTTKVVVYEANRHINA